jgi:xanthine/CO dehydrogenase XdhC/CoxF family maturation factor
LAPSFGVIGSGPKASLLIRELTQRCISTENQNSFFCLVGIPIRNNTPAEISFSITVSLIQRRNKLGFLDHKLKSF